MPPAMTQRTLAPSPATKAAAPMAQESAACDRRSAACRSPTGCVRSLFRIARSQSGAARTPQTPRTPTVARSATSARPGGRRSVPAGRTARSALGSPYGEATTASITSSAIALRRTCSYRNPLCGAVCLSIVFTVRLHMARGWFIRSARIGQPPFFLACAQKTPIDRGRSY